MEYFALGNMGQKRGNYQLALEHGCEINEKTGSGETPLHIAAKHGDYNTTTLVLSHGADTLLEDKDQKTAEQLTPSNSMMWMAMSVHKHIRRAFSRPTLPLNFERIICKDMSRGFAKVQVSCVNAVDAAECPACSNHESSFNYITKNFYIHPDMQPNRALSKETQNLCNCTDKCSDGTSCSCLIMSDGRCWYDKRGCLVPEFNHDSHSPIYECTQFCSCNNLCKNRVVQHGVKYRLQVYRTNYMGWGLRSLDPIPKGAFVVDYVGEVLSDNKANELEEDTYIFDLTVQADENSLFCVDANNYGNCSRFINHICEPNLCSIRVFTGHRDSRFPTLAFFSLKDIAPLEELGFNYGSHFWDIKRKRNIYCQCGSNICKYSREAYDKK